jgi:hypothetical protein
MRKRGAGSDFNGGEVGVQRVAGEQLAPLAVRQVAAGDSTVHCPTAVVAHCGATGSSWASGGAALRFLLSHMTNPDDVHFFGIARLDLGIELIIGDFRGEAVCKRALFDGPGDRFRGAIEGKHVVRPG